MAQRKTLVKVLKTKIHFVTAQKEELQKCLDTYIDQETGMAMASVESEEQDLKTITKINSKLDAVLHFLLRKSAEVKEITSGSVALVSDSHLLQSLLPMMSGLPSTSAPKTFNGPELANISHRIEALETAMATCHKEVHQSTAQQKEIKDTVDCLNAKVDNILTDNSKAEKMRFLRNDSTEAELKKLQELGDVHEQKLENADDKLKQIDLTTLNTVKLCQCHERFSELEDTTQQTEDKISTKLTKLESKVIGDIKDRLDQVEEKCTASEKLNHKRLGDICKQLKEIGMKNTEMAKQSMSKMNVVEKQVKKWEGGKGHSAPMKELDTLKKQLSKFQSLDKQVETLTCSLQDQIEDVQRIKRVMKELATRMETKVDKSDLTEIIKTDRKSLEELSSKVDATESLVRSSVSYREKEKNKRRELEDRILVVEASRKRDLVTYTKRMDEQDSLYKQVCHLVDSKVTPLRRLLRILNNLHMEAEKRELASKLGRVMEQVKDISDQVDNLKAEWNEPPAGFTAYFSVSKHVDEGAIIDYFSDVLYNNGNQYNPSTGKFTAPKNGLYLTSVTLRQLGEGVISAQVIHRSPGNISNIVCRLTSSMASTSSCGLGLVSLKTGDTLSVEAYNAHGSFFLSEFSSFSCILIK